MKKKLTLVAAGALAIGTYAKRRELLEIAKTGVRTVSTHVLTRIGLGGVVTRNRRTSLRDMVRANMAQNPDFLQIGEQSDYSAAALIRRYQLFGRPGTSGWPRTSSTSCPDDPEGAL